MVSQIISCISQSSSLLCISDSRSLVLPNSYNRSGLRRFSPGFTSRRLITVNRRKWRSPCIFNSGKESGGDGKFCFDRINWINVVKLSLDEKAEILFLDQGLKTCRGTCCHIHCCQSLRDILGYDLKQPFNLQKGWLVWGGIGLVAAVGAIALTGVWLLCPEPPGREVDSLMKLLPLIGSSNISTVSLVGITGILAPLLEETVFRGFFMVSLTKWVPTPIAIIISSAASDEFPQLFILGNGSGYNE